MTGLARRQGLRPVSAKRAAAAAGPVWSTLAPGSGLQRSARLAPVSARRRQENRVRGRMVRAKYPERPLCVVYVLFQHHPGLIPAEVISRCGRWADDGHEPLTRGRGGSITDPDNIEPPCRYCHDAIGLEPAWAYELGLLKHSWPTPPQADVA